MRKKGIDVIIKHVWSERKALDGRDVQYRIWSKKEKVYCLKLTHDTNCKRIDVSQSLENVDHTVGVIFEIPELPFDSQYSARFYESNVELTVGKKNYEGLKAQDKLKDIFNYKSYDKLIQHIFEGCE